MEVIRKKICLEDFISRIPGATPIMDIVGEENIEKTSSWGNIPYKMSFLERYEYGEDAPIKKFKYQTLVSIYYRCLDVVKNATYYELDRKGNKWIMADMEWRDMLRPETKNQINFIGFVAELPESGAVDRDVYGLTSEEGVRTFYDEVKRMFVKECDGFDVIEEFSEIIGEIFVPSVYDDVALDGPHVPYTVFAKHVPQLIKFMEDLKSKSETGCCDLKLYLDYGGDAFLSFLRGINISLFPKKVETEETTLDIPLLITSNVLDLGLFRADDVEYVDENGDPIEREEEPCMTNGSGLITGVTGESQLLTLRKRKVSVDDNNVELPGIYYPGMSYLEMPYEVGYIKNIQVRDGVFYGDTIYELKEEFAAYVGGVGTFTLNASGDSVEDNTYKDDSVVSEYPDIRYRAGVAAKDGKIAGFEDGTIETPIDGLTVAYENEYGTKEMEHGAVMLYVLNQTLRDLKNLASSLKSKLENNYPEYFCFEQPYEFKYKCTYGVTVHNEDGTTTREERFFDFVREGMLYVIFRTAINVTYVLGGELKVQGENVTLIEKSPYELTEEQYDTWNGMGVWYNERYPFSKIATGTYVMDGQAIEVAYDYIDIESKMHTYEFKGIDFPRKNYILSTDIRYSSAFHDNCTSYPVFRDDKMLGVSMDMQTDYDVLIDRGATGAFERHLKLSEVKTFMDLENYGNNYFNI